LSYSSLFTKTCLTIFFQAEDISRHAKYIFEALDVVPQYLDLESSLSKRRPGRKPKNREQNTSHRDSTGMKPCPHFIYM